MIQHIKASDRFRSQMDWLESRHPFSFGPHYDPSRMGFGPLRVLNEDWIAPRSGFPMHAHREMEILTYVISGRLRHRDSEGHEGEVRTGRAQLMHAGTGIAHSELNLDPDEPVHLLQIWIEPSRLGSSPGHEALDFSLEPGQPLVLASPEAESGGMPIRQDAVVSALRLAADQRHPFSLEPGRLGWLQAVAGEGWIHGTPFEPGDGFAIHDVDRLEVDTRTDAELLWFDLPK